MRLYLSSFRLGDATDRLLALGRGARRIALIGNACDLSPQGERTGKIEQETQALRSLGLDPVELDLRRFFRQPGSDVVLERLLADFDYVWVRGGNSFVLRRAMAASGCDAAITRMLKADRLVYAGYSAGIDMLPATLRGLDLVDDATSVPPDYDLRATVWDGFGLIPFSLAPHYRSNHPESADVERCVEFFISHHIPFIALRDGEVLVIEGNEIQVYKDMR